MPLPPGKRLGSYEILATIGVGGMGEVYKARDTRLERTVAIKVLPDHVAADAELKQRFEREAKAISSLTHPHICTLYDVGSDDGVDFLVMEFLEGETAAERLAKGPLPIQQVLRCGIEIAEALERAHRQGITHRDLKPGNVMLTKAGAKLLDFGLARLNPVVFERGAGSAPTLAPELTRSGTILGTLQYMAPEQVEGAAVDHRADIFAFGAILYELATGQKAFDGRSQASIIGSILRDEPPPISKLQPFAPRALDALVATCLAKDPDERWQSAADVGKQLRLMQSSSSQDSGKTPAQGGRAARVATAIAAAASLLAATLALLYVLRDDPTPPETRVEIVTPPTSDALSFAISPDGRQLAFVVGNEEAKALWLRSLDSATALPLPGTAGASYPFWSPDNRSIGFFANGKLKRVDVSGAQVRELADATEGRGGAWSSDGVIVFAPEPSLPLHRVPAVGGEPEIHGSVSSARFPQFLPDGRRFIFLDVTGAAGRRRGVYLGSLDSDETVFLASSESAARFVPPDWLLSISGTTLVARRFDLRSATTVGDPVVVADPVDFDDNVSASAFSVSTNGTVAYRPDASSSRQLVWFDRAGKAVGVVGAPDENDLMNVELSPDETRVAVVRLIGNFRTLWLMDVDRGVLTQAVDGPIVGSARWSFDARRLAFYSNRAESAGLHVLDTVVGSDEVLLPGSLKGALSIRGDGPEGWSPDGRLLFYTTREPATLNDLWVVPLEGDRRPSVFLDSRYDEDSAQVSPDGRWVAYRSSESGRSEVYIRAYPGPGPKVQVSSRGGTEPRWSRDGREVFYMSLEAELTAASVSWTDGTPRVGAPESLFRTRKTRAGAVGLPQQYDVSRDGRFLINVGVEDDLPRPISLLMNWNPRR